MHKTKLRLSSLMALVMLSMPLSAEEPKDNVQAEPIAFNGLIIDGSGKGIKARVEVKGRDKLTMSDKRGRFGLTNIDPCDTLIISVRKEQIVVPVEGRRSLCVTLDTEGVAYRYEACEDEELANIGFGYVKRRESTQFTSGISGDRLRATGCSNVIDAIMVCYPALYKNNGELYLRFSSSISCPTPVLVLCDGVETNVNAINIYDVEQVEILKDSGLMVKKRPARGDKIT